MPLTTENMESRVGLMSHSIFRDIPRMDDEQLSRYMRMAFTGKRDLAFLPEPFWDYWFKYGKHGSSSDGREPNSPAAFLAGIHDTLGSVARGTFTVGSRNEEKPDFSYRPRFRRVLGSLLDECIAVQGTPTSEQTDLASYAVEAVGAIQSIESFNLYYMESRKSRPTPEELLSIPEDYPKVLRADLEALRAERAKLLDGANLLIKSGRFGELKLRY